MPLSHGSSKEAFSSNVSELMHSGRPQKQALAIAYRVKREGRAMGGPPSQNPPWFVRNEARSMAGHVGGLNSPVPGRTDKLPITVGGGAYVLPSDHVSALGQNNTAAGMQVLNHMFGHQGPYGMGTTPAIVKGRGAPAAPKAPKFAAGGGTGKPVPIIAAGGEFVIPPEVVAQIGGGDIERGHNILDHWVIETRKKHVKTLRNLPKPAKS